MKTSQFLNIVEKKDCYILHNALYPVILKVDDPRYKRIVDSILKMNNYDLSTYTDDEIEFFDILKKLRFIISDAENELNIVNYAYNIALKQRPMQVFVFPTRNCNFRCPYCYESHDSADMTVDILHKSIDFIVQHAIADCRKSILISWFGGEPTIKSELILTFMQSLKKKLPSHISLAGQMTTNGFLLNSRLFDEFVKNGITKYQVTIDGLAMTHDSTRVHVSGRPTWNTIIQNLLEIQKTNLDFRMVIRTNITEKMLDTLDEWMRFLSQTFARDRRFTFHFETVKDLGGDDRSHVFMQDDPTKIIASLSRHYGLARSMYSKYLKPFSFMCYASDPSSIAIDTNGKLLKCTVAIDQLYNNVGNIDNGYDIERVAWWTSYDLNEKCKKCPLLPLCYGRKCPNSYYSPETCAMVKETYYAALETYENE